MRNLTSHSSVFLPIPHPTSQGPSLTFSEDKPTYLILLLSLSPYSQCMVRVHICRSFLHILHSPFYLCQHPPFLYQNTLKSQLTHNSWGRGIFIFFDHEILNLKLSTTISFHIYRLMQHSQKEINISLPCYIFVHCPQAQWSMKELHICYCSSIPSVQSSVSSCSIHIHHPSSEASSVLRVLSDNQIKTTYLLSHFSLLMVNKRSLGIRKEPMIQKGNTKIINVPEIIGVQNFLKNST